MTKDLPAAGTDTASVHHASPGSASYDEDEQALPRDHRSLLDRRETQVAIFELRRREVPLSIGGGIEDIWARRNIVVLE